MTFLPIVERELRVAARRPLTYWLRLIAAGFGLLIFGVLISFALVSPGLPWSAGQMQFTVLKWLAFAFAASAGIFLTSDSLSEEKREGTLGLLFLTDLRGYDVVFGKLMSHSLQAFYALLAAFPILALPLLEGGVTGTQFGRALLVICNTLFFSLAMGILVSSISREVLKAMNAALVLTLLFLIGLPWVDLGLAGWKYARFKCITSIASPGHLFWVEPGLRPADFWGHLGAQHLLCWIFLALATFCVPRAWQDKNTNAKGPRQSLLRRWRYGGRKARLALREKLLPKNPILWLASRDRWMPRTVWVVLVIALGLSGYSLCLRWMGVNSPVFIALRGIDSLVILGLFLWIGSQSCRLFVESVRNGAMELILVTPTTPRQIVYGQWWALCRAFFLPVLLLVVIHALNGMEAIAEMKRAMANARGGSAAFSMVTYQAVTLATGMVTLVTDLVAMAWFGMWTGITSRKTSIAVLKMIVFVCVLPWLAGVFVQIFGLVFVGRMNFPFWFGNVLATTLELVKNVLFIVWSRNQLLTRLPEMVTRATGEAAHRQIAALPSPAPPPVMPAMS